jgi:hypothetical protein
MQETAAVLMFLRFFGFCILALQIGEGQSEIRGEGMSELHFATANDTAVRFLAVAARFPPVLNPDMRI